MHPERPITSAALQAQLLRLCAKFPFIYRRELTKTAFSRPISALQVGQGDTKILLTAAHHANEYITAMSACLLLERYCRALCHGGKFGGQSAGTLYHRAMLYLVPVVNPDGVDLVTGGIAPGSREYALAASIAARYPAIPFPAGWKANLRGVDLNLNYPAGWENAVRIKAGVGFDGPAPRDFPGLRPLSETETMALAGYTCCVHPHMVLALHTQGGVIYHRFAGGAPAQSDGLAETFSAASGYALEEVPPESDNGGYKDWFLHRFRRPGFTIECGLGENPLPLEQLEDITDRLERLLAAAMLS